MNKILGVIIVLVVLSGSVISQQEVPPIRNFIHMNKEFCAGAQPRLEHLAMLKAEGVKSIINLRVPTEHRAGEEEAKAKELGLKYFNIPVVFADPKDEQVAEFLRITDDPENRPAFIHCAASIRVGAFWLIRRVVRDGWTFDAALKEAETVGLKESPHLVEFAKKYIANHPAASTPSGQKDSSSLLPTEQMKMGAFLARFDPGGSFTLQGQGWPALNGSWKMERDEVELRMSGGPGGCDGPGRYRLSRSGTAVTFALVSDECRVRQMIINDSVWKPVTEPNVIPVRRLELTASAKPGKKAEGSANGSWPSFRGAEAAGIAENQNLPEKWNGKTGENILWHSAIPGLAHSSPVVWGNKLFVTSAVSSDPKATFRPGLYGDGDASKDRSKHRWMIYALDKKSGKMLWERVAYEGEPLEKRHIKSTYANSTPATDGRIVVAWFGSQGVHAYDVNGKFLWKVNIGRVDMGAYDIPTYEWGPASSPIIWNDLVIIQCDTQADSFLLALDAATGKTVWKTERQEIPSWGTPTVAMTANGPVLVTNASNFIRGYDPRTGKELWRLGRSSKITAPTPIFAEDLFVVASGRGPERPIFVVKTNASGDLTLPEGKDSSDSIVWSKTGRGSYMPTPLVYKGILYVLANNGLFDAYNLKTGAEIYRQRLPLVGSGFSASPVAADGKIYLSNEDGEVLVVAAGEKFELLGTNSIGELLMATPALSEGVMYVRASTSLFAIGRKR
ncbi:MAG TPA: PQQ-binding-like beta-propeller repeat protein [Pyrinomonadaceae bacterium]|nr:PQQ-binding-like beta-propeller repeat protein [Pyrinomonadaceae bacterium]